MRCLLILIGSATVLSCTLVSKAWADFGDELLRFTSPDSGIDFGQSVDISGNRVVVGTGEWTRSSTPDDDRWCPTNVLVPAARSELSNREEVYVFDYTIGSDPIHVLRSDPSNADWFGKSVALDGNLAIVGAPFEDANGLLDSGAAYVFDVTTGEQLFRLVPDDASEFDRLGYEVAIDGNLAAVTSICSRSVYIYDTTNGRLVHRLTEDNPWFGASVAIEENTVVVGAFVGVDGGSGSVFAFDAPTGEMLWTAEGDSMNDLFGFSVDINDNRTIVGAPLASRNTGSGAVVILDSSTGDQLTELQPVSRHSFGDYGIAVAIDGDLAIVGYPNQFRNTGTAPGGTYVFDAVTGEREQLIWGDEVGLNEFMDSMFFGRDLAISGLAAAVGRQRADTVHVFDLSGTPPPQVIDTQRPIKRTPGVIQPGDADRDQDFDQYDVVQVLQAARYRTPEPATWAEGDFDGDGFFLGYDLVAASTAGVYRTGPYDNQVSPSGNAAPIECCGVQNDDNTSLVYDAATGELAIDAPDRPLTSIIIDSMSGIFTGDPISRETLWGVYDFQNDHAIFKGTFGDAFESISFGNVARPNLTLDFLLGDLSAGGSLLGGGGLGMVDLVYLGQALPQLMPGDADQDLNFDQLDIIQVATAAKYLTGQAATWGEGDWDGGPGGSPGNPPVGDSLFNQLDIIAALNGNTYLSGPYAAIQPAGARADSQTSLVYDSATGNLSVDAPAGFDLTSINIQSATAIFTESPAENLEGAFDNDTDDNIFKATFGGSFGSLSFGQVATPGLSRDFLLSDLTVQGSLAGGGALGDVDLIYIPEPAAISLLGIAVATIVVLASRKKVRWR